MGQSDIQAGILQQINGTAAGFECGDTVVRFSPGYADRGISCGEAPGRWPRARRCVCGDKGHARIDGPVLKLIVVWRSLLRNYLQSLVVMGSI